MYLSNVVRVANLGEIYPERQRLLIIDALGEGDELVARAWCAERRTHAIVRRGGGCCFSCAVKMATGRAGLGVNVLIWSS
jgi:hypothetical protein